jgi:hypothetical protein
MRLLNMWVNITNNFRVPRFNSSALTPLGPSAYDTEYKNYNPGLSVEKATIFIQR